MNKDILSQCIQFISSHPIIIIATCFVLMVYAAWEGWRSIKRNLFKDYKSIIISIGVLGTFIGIFFWFVEF